MKVASALEGFIPFMPVGMNGGKLKGTLSGYKSMFEKFMEG